MKPFLLLLVAVALSGGEPAIDPAVHAAYQRGIAWLAAHCDGNGEVTTGQGNRTATTALAGLALAGAGVLPTTPGAQGEAANRMLGYLLRDERVDNEGYLGRHDGSRMYGHGIITLYFAELLGMGVEVAAERKLRARLTRAIELILWSQKQKGRDNRDHFGGWRYDPNSGDSDLSATVWQLMALRGAKLAGLPIDRKPIDEAVQYLRFCYSRDRDAQGNPKQEVAACAYQPGGSPNYATAAAGLLSFQVAGAYDLPEVKGSAEWLLRCEIKPDMAWFFYGTYYYSQGMNAAGGTYADISRKRTTELLLPLQHADGHWDPRWDNEREAGPVYATAMAMLALSVQYRYLPIYQR